VIKKVVVDTTTVNPQNLPVNTNKCTSGHFFQE